MGMCRVVAGVVAGGKGCLKSAPGVFSPVLGYNKQKQIQDKCVQELVMLLGNNFVTIDNRNRMRSNIDSASDSIWRRFSVKELPSLCFSVELI